MSESEPRPNLPTPLGPRRRLIPRNGLPKATFLSQLLAERYSLAPQRERRRAPLALAIRSYDAGEHSDERRLPIGRSGARHGPHHLARPFHLRSSSAFVTTLTLENAIAAPAITGFSQPSAASGTPIRL